MKTKRAINLLMYGAHVVLYAFVGIACGDGQGHWDCDSRGVPFGGGDGSESEPYRICAPEHLNAMNDHTERAVHYFVLARDMDVEGVETLRMIGSPSYPFIGHFDGNHKHIRNLLVDREDEPLAGGLFGYIGSEGIVKDLLLKDIEVKGRRDVGGLAGQNFGQIQNVQVSGSVHGNNNIGGLVGLNMGTIEAVQFAGNVEGVGDVVVGVVAGNQGTIRASHSTGHAKGGSAVGGLVGDNRGEVVDSHSSSDIEASHYVGGLAGRNWGGSVDGSYASGRVRGTGNFVGGLAGFNWNASIRDAHATGDVTGGGDVGGLVGRNSDSSSITRSYATGHTEGGLGVGGLAGTNFSESSIDDAYATGNVEGKDMGVGGLVGQNNAQISNAYATGDVEGAVNYVGGLIGRHLGSLTRGYATGSVKGGTHYVGGLIGEMPVMATLDRAYWDRETSGMDVSDGGTDLSTADFADATKFTDWDFDDHWVIGTAPDGEVRPIFVWQEE